MRFALHSVAFSVLTAATLALAGCSAGAPADIDEDVDREAGGDEAVAESRDAIQGDEDVDCAHARCKTGEALDAECNPCVARICEVDPFCCDAFWDGLCVSEVETVCNKQCNDKQLYGKCGDGKCQGNEDCSTCPTDCGFCPPECGNGWCEVGESCSDCSQDCGACPACGDGMCTYGIESCDSCPQDCTGCSCGDECQSGPPQLASCSDCAAQVCAQDPFCCTIMWDGLCVVEAQSLCGLTCN